MHLTGGEIPTKRNRAAAKPPDAGAGAGGVEEDRLSALPDDTLVLILLRLGTAGAAGRTSVLSRRWRRVWALLPELRFPVAPRPHLVASALSAHEAALRELIVGTLDATPESVAAWLPIAARRLSGDLVYCNVVPAGGAAEEEERGAFELPCLENATGVGLDLGFVGLAVPPAGVFARLTELSLSRVRFHGPGELGDAVSSPRCPSLLKLSVSYAYGLLNLAINSESLLQVELQHLDRLQKLTIVGSRLQRLKLLDGLAYSEPVASISAPQLVMLEWRDWYDPRSIHLGDMEHLQCLTSRFFIVYGKDDLNMIAHNRACLRLLQRFKVIKFLLIMLAYAWDIGDQYLMNDMTALPDIHCLQLMVMANGHSFGASSFHVLRICTSIRKLMVGLCAPTDPEAQPTCPSGCICDQPPDWKTEELLLKHLHEVDIRGLRGYEHEVAFVRRLFHWVPALKKMTVTFDDSVSGSMARELHQMLQSFSRTEICMEFYRYQGKTKVLYAPED